MDRLGMKVGPALRLRKRLAEAAGKRCKKCLYCAGQREQEKNAFNKKDVDNEEKD